MKELFPILIAVIFGVIFLWVMSEAKKLGGYRAWLGTLFPTAEEIKLLKEYKTARDDYFKLREAWRQAQYAGMPKEIIDQLNAAGDNAWKEKNRLTDKIMRVQEKYADKVNYDQLIEKWKEPRQ